VKAARTMALIRKPNVQLHSDSKHSKSEQKVPKVNSAKTWDFASASTENVTSSNSNTANNSAYEENTQETSSNTPNFLIISTAIPTSTSTTPARQTTNKASSTTSSNSTTSPTPSRRPSTNLDQNGILSYQGK
jgi:hypothetical protein